MTPREATTAVLEAWERGDAAAVAELFAADGRYEDPLFPEAIVGPEAIHAAVAPAMAEIRKLEIPVRAIAETGNVAICEASFRAELASGEGRFDFDFAMTVEVRDGKIVRLTEYFDTQPLVT